MAELYTVDASIFLNAYNAAEAGHQGSAAFLARLQADSTPMIEPVLLLPEAAAAIARGRRDVTLARSFAGALALLPNLVLVALDRELAERAVDVAARYRLRGSDAVYVAVALRFNADLVTRDREQRERVAGVLTVFSPEQALSRSGL